MDFKQACLLLGGVLLGIGALFGFLPVKALGADCGSAFAEEDYASALCDDAVNERRTDAVAFGLPGLVLLGVGGIAILRQAEAAASEGTRKDSAFEAWWVREGRRVDGSHATRTGQRGADAEERSGPDIGT